MLARSVKPVAPFLGVYLLVSFSMVLVLCCKGLMIFWAAIENIDFVIALSQTLACVIYGMGLGAIPALILYSVFKILGARWRRNL